jgi:hypothetical protein
MLYGLTQSREAVQRCGALIKRGGNIFLVIISNLERIGFKFSFERRKRSDGHMKAFFIYDFVPFFSKISFFDSVFGFYFLYTV